MEPGEAEPSRNGVSRWYHVVIKPMSRQGWATSKLLGQTLSPTYITPQEAVKDSAGRPKVSRDGRPYLNYVETAGQWSSKLMVKWATRNPVYQTLPAEVRKMNNALKSFVNDDAAHALLVYHVPAGKKEVCSEDGLPHLHIVHGSTDGVKLNHTPKYRAVVRAAKEADFRCYSRTVDLSIVLNYLKQDPGTYTMFGTNSCVLGRAFRRAVPGTVAVPLGSPDEADDLDQSLEIPGVGGFGVVDFNGTKADARHLSSDPFGEEPLSQRPVASNPLDPFAEDVHEPVPDMDTTRGANLACLPNENSAPFNVDTEKKPKPVKITKVAVTDALTRLLLASKARKVTEVVTFVLKNVQTADEAIGHPEWPSNEKLGNFLAMYQQQYFKELCTKLIDVETVDDTVKYSNIIEYLTAVKLQDSVCGRKVARVRESAMNFWRWCEEMSLNPKEVIIKSLDVMLKADPQKSGIVLQGGTTVGKSYWFSEPFKALPDMSKVGFATNHEVFGFEGCVDKQIILIDENNMSPVNVQTYKSVLRGNLTKVEIKHKPSATMQKTPVFMNSNREFTYGLPSTEVGPLLQRVHLFKLFPVDLDATRVWMQEADHPNPKMWVYFYQKYYATHQDTISTLREMGWPDVMDDYEFCVDLLTSLKVRDRLLEGKYLRMPRVIDTPVKDAVDGGILMEVEENHQSLSCGPFKKRKHTYKERTYADDIEDVVEPISPPAYLDGMEAKKKEKVIMWAVTMGREKREGRRTKIQQLKEELSQRAASRRQKKAEKERKKIEAYLKTIKIKDLISRFPQLGKDALADLEDILSDHLTGRHICHCW